MEVLRERKKLRNNSVKVFLSEGEKKKLKDKASNLGLSLMAYMRMTSLHAKIQLKDKGEKK